MAGALVAAAMTSCSVNDVTSSKDAAADAVVDTSGDDRVTPPGDAGPDTVDSGCVPCVVGSTNVGQCCVQ